LTRRLEILVQPGGGRRSLPFLRDHSGATSIGVETDERLARIGDGLAEAGGARVRPEVSGDRLDRVLLAVHSRRYLEFLASWDDRTDEQAAFVDHPFVQAGVAPDTPLMPGMYALAREAASIAVEAAGRALAGGNAIYALCRPPGHHAGPAFLGGYCYLNNAALAAMHLRREAGLDRVAVVDLDLHFGNGTAEALAGEPGTYFGSVHASTATSYPYVEVVPRSERQRFHSFEHPPSPSAWLAKVDDVVRGGVDFGAQAIVVSLGYDPVRADPHGGWDLDPDVFTEVGRLVGSPNLPVCVVQEGGYNLDLLAACACCFGRGVIAS
jgi:acetoin utilization deacetylase AcuC-like enzyme